MTITPNLRLTKDDNADLYSVERVNANSDKIDQFAGEIAAALAAKANTADLAGKIYGTGTILSPAAESPIDLNGIIMPDKYQCEQSAAAHILNLPADAAGCGFALYVSENGSASSCRQTLYINDPRFAGVFYERYCYTDNEWTPWYKFTGEAVA